MAYLPLQNQPMLQGPLLSHHLPRSLIRTFDYTGTIRVIQDLYLSQESLILITYTQSLFFSWEVIHSQVLRISVFFFPFLFFSLFIFPTYIFLYFFKFYFIFKIYITVLDLPNIKMNLPQVYMCSPS